VQLSQVRAARQARAAGLQADEQPALRLQLRNSALTAGLPLAARCLYLLHRLAKILSAAHRQQRVDAAEVRLHEVGVLDGRSGRPKFCRKRI
jgi:hypothetical protein